MLALVFLGGDVVFHGILQSDGYAAYEAYARGHPEVTWVGCWAHARGKFFEAQSEWPKAVRLILLIIGWLYECEALWDQHALSESNRQRHRQKHYPRRLYWLKTLALGILHGNLEPLTQRAHDRTDPRRGPPLRMRT